MVFDISLEMQSDSKNYATVQDEEITDLVHTIKSQMVFIRLPVTVSNGLNARQSELFTEFRLKFSIKPIKSTWFFLEMSSDPKKYFGFTFDQFTELVYTAKIAQLSTQPFGRLPVTVSN